MIIFHLFYLLHKSLYTNDLRGPGRRNLLTNNDLGGLVLVYYVEGGR
jgi:hypothetical protein